MKKEEKLILADAVGNLYRAAFFLGRSPKGKSLADEMLARTLKIFQRMGMDDANVAQLKNQISKIKTKRQRLVVAERILDEYKKMARIV